jgi:hypothetical protein
VDNIDYIPIVPILNMNTFSTTYRPVLNSDMFEDDLLYYDPVLDFVKY